MMISLVRRWFVLLCLLSLGCDPGETNHPAPASAPAIAAPVAPTMPVVVVDARHSILGAQRTEVPYVLPHGNAILLDARRFRFDDPDRLLRQPNVVRVFYEKSEYTLPWPQKGEQTCELGRGTLKLIKGSEFPGFEVGKEAAIGIGYESVDPLSKKILFKEFWVARILFTQ